MVNVPADVRHAVGTDLVLLAYDPSMAGSENPSADADGTVPGRPCPHCGASMIRRHCKYVCPEHGVVWDCSDTFY